MSSRAVRGTGGASERTGTGIVALLLVLQLTAVLFLWALNPYGPKAEPAFAIYLVVVLLSFSMISYVYRAVKEYGRVGRAPIFVGSCAVLLLLFAGLFA